MMAYMVSIIRASEDYAGSAWVQYDAAYRRQAATNGNRTWSRINPSLYSVCFTGKAQGLSRCELCLASSHKTSDCALSCENDPDLPTRLKAVEAAVVAFVAPKVGGERKDPTKFSEELCRSWNQKRCTFRRCRYRHACSNCGGGHPAADCYGKQKGQQRAPNLSTNPFRTKPY